MAPTDANEAVSLVYFRSQFSDDDIKNYLLDAARSVGADLTTRWTVSSVDYTVTDIHGEFWDVENQIWKSPVEELIMYRTALAISQERVNSAAVDAIKIKDGDTSIDTSATARAGEESLKRTSRQYQDQLLTTRSNRFTGFTQGA